MLLFRRVCLLLTLGCLCISCSGFILGRITFLVAKVFIGIGALLWLCLWWGCCYGYGDYDLYYSQYFPNH